jgi:phosphohistidine phosphatase SixA
MHKQIIIICLISIISVSLIGLVSASNQKYVYIMRHAEKDFDAEMGLNDVGVKHANCLADYYFGPFPLGSPEYGMAKSSRTIRPIETLDIIANKLNISTVNCTKNESVKDVAKNVLKTLVDHNNVLLVWENNIIPQLATTLGCTTCKSWNYNPMAKKHNPHFFNSTWVLTFPYRTDYKLRNVKDYKVTLRVYDQNFINDECQPEFEYTFRQF